MNGFNGIVFLLPVINWDLSMTAMHPCCVGRRTSIWVCQLCHLLFVIYEALATYYSERCSESDSFCWCTDSPFDIRNAVTSSNNVRLNDCT